MSAHPSKLAGRSLAALIVIGALTARSEAGSLGTVTDLGPMTRIGGIGPDGMIVGGGPVGPGMPALSHAFINNTGTVTDLGTLGGSTSSAGAVNASGQVVGESYLSNNTDNHAFLYAGGALTDLGTLGGNYSTATGINASGQIVGQSRTAGGDIHAFTIANGKTTDLGTLGGSASSAAGINDAGQIIGQSDLTGGGTHAVLFAGGKLTDLGTLGGSSSFGYGINAAGNAVGQAYTANDASAHAVLWSNGATTDLGVLPGFQASVARSINDAGQIVGNSYGKVDPISGALVQHAFLYDQGLMADLNGFLPAGSGWVLSEASSISKAGLITGFGLDNGQRHAYSLNLGPAASVPEPTTLALVGLLLVGAGARRLTRRRRA